MAVVSVIIPTYNMAHYISEAIDSVLSQTYKDFEIIISDDGSTDNTRELVKKYDGQMIYIYQENSGINPARRHGLQKAKGKYITLLDADDKWVPDKLQEQVEFMETFPEIDLNFSDFYNFNESGVNTQTFLNSNKTFRNILTKSLSDTHPLWKVFDQEFLYEYLIGNFILPSTLMIKKDICINFGIWESNYFVPREMYEFFLRSIHRIRIGFVDKVLVYRRLHNKSITFLNAEKYYEKTIEIYQKAKEYPWMNAQCQNYLNQELTNTYYRLGRYNFIRGNLDKARFQIRRSLKGNFSLRPFILFCMAYLVPPRFMTILKKLKQPAFHG